ncbi:hypothetical protein DJ568_12850 [Mucilaginibacter hurinus]|uniref:VWA domain-containing protein n=2 Tax=Mucilaginibacter hurinus TaxID=2201324 RepID=A0A367GL35_9SPHI|nr:hypothetical protein DJ568_12850 [Mucilaginibacter hurinus]
MLFLFNITWGSVSAWWLPACVVAALLYGWVMYRQPINLSKNFRYALFVLRAVAVFIITLLLLSPLVKSVRYKPEKPLVLVLQDNSRSVSLTPNLPPQDVLKSFVNSLKKLKADLGEEYEVREFHFDSGLRDGLLDKFDGRKTDISAALKQLNERFANRNIGAVVLATDGLYNRGADPQYEARDIKSPFYTVALGDTTPRRDLLIANVNYNKTAFLGNDFMVEILAEAYQSNGERMRVNLAEDGRQVHTQTIAITDNNFRKLLPVRLTAGKKGLRKFTISISPVANELTTANNSETIYVEVLDARQKTLLVYEHVHPDIGVLRSAIQSNRNYEVKTVTVNDVSTLKLGDYGLIILYQTSGNSSATLKKFLNSARVPVWYTVGAQTDLGAFNSVQKVSAVSSSTGNVQEVFALPAADFPAFTLSDSTRDKLTKMPPLQAPFGTYSTGASTSILLKQKIGSVPTSYPLLAFNDSDKRRMAVLMGEGLWRWQLAEFNTYGSHTAINELMGQTVQYLTANAGKEQFRVYTNRAVFDEGENVVLNAELYNDALQQVNTPDIKLELQSQAGKRYNYLFTRTNRAYTLEAAALPVGEYTYKAATKLGQKVFTATGIFTVKPLNMEERQTAANHGLLRDIARQSGGAMLLPVEVSKLADLIRKNDNIKTVVYEDKRYSDLVDIKWVFGMILILLSAEWFLRKREGEV